MAARKNKLLSLKTHGNKNFTHDIVFSYPDQSQLSDWKGIE